MALDADDIKESFPEFDLDSDVETPPNTDQDSVITAKLAEAESMVDRTVFPSEANADSCVKYLTAHLLALSPAAVNLRLVRKDGSTLYYMQYERLARRAGAGFLVP